ncbi:DNA-3-methyladenine glycosylase I [Alteromonas aestuariivivens]|uniref:DNA-3-methyladenine glycosylase I n=1 Tax=Alteromonas aestuariivivens TaxID=1938339 RepID=A0A3D8M3H5_9ALTE|nr:DNA-3-methyladenine glycosylase I [Alteromonas aestuariivivens]RDV24168.1 DNA-3-methyladenine glycosylase I [Alteromonas aestuariivivens]
MTAERFDSIYQRAAERKGGSAALESLLSAPLNKQQVAAISNDRFLSAMTKKVFQSGFVWRVIEQKWPDFEAAFFAFDIEKVLLMPDEMLEQRATDPKIVRNYKKIMTVRDNALMIQDVSQKHGSFGQFVASYEAHNITELWQFLKEHGARLGGNTGPYMLRSMGVDTFLLSQDVEDYLRKHEVFSGSPTSKRSLAAINAQFAEWQQQSGRPLQHLSLILAYSWGTNHSN